MNGSALETRTSPRRWPAVAVVGSLLAAPLVAGAVPAVAAPPAADIVVGCTGPDHTAAVDLAALRTAIVGATPTRPSRRSG